MITATLLPGFVGPTLPPWLNARLRDGLAGVCLFAQNISTARQLRDLTDAVYAANDRAIIAVDEEGGDVTRLFAATGARSVGNAVLGRVDDVDVTRSTAVEIGAELRRAGVNVDFAPSVDINSRADNPVIGVRSFGPTPGLVGRHGVAWIEGLQSTGVAATAKHFPGHGDTGQDSHVALPVVDRSLAELHERELLPFSAAVGAGVRLVMTSHILLPQLDAEHPATMSRVILQDLLRDELGFTSVIVSDALDMAGAQGGGGSPAAAVRALRAGCDLLCLGTANTDAELAAIEEAVRTAPHLDSARVEEAAGRVQALGAELAAWRSRAEPGGEGPAEAGPALGLDRIAATFDVQPGAGSWRAAAAEGYAVVRLETTANRAVGGTPWGPFAVDPDFASPPTSWARPVLAIGRDIHRHADARQVVDELRGEHAYVLVVDMGWPDEERHYADVATFGASRLMGEALLAWLGR